MAKAKYERTKPHINIGTIGHVDEPKSTVVTGVEMFRKLLDQAQAGDNVGLLLRGIQRNEIQRGQVLAKPGSIRPHTCFVGKVYVLTKEEGGRTVGAGTVTEIIE